MLEMIESTMWTRRFSEIRDVQKEKTIRYEVIGETPSPCGLRLTVESEGITYEDKEAEITDSREEAIELGLYLYENGAGLETWRDLVSDFMGTRHPINWR